MNKFYLSIVIFCLLSIIFIPALAKASLVPCDTNCSINDFFTMLVNIYNFIVWQIATPLATIALIIGGAFMMISAGNPNQFNLGKTIVYSAIIGLVLVFGSWLIINTILTTLGYNGSWWAFSS